MTGLEQAALRAGKVVVTQAARSWLTRRKSDNRRGAELAELIALRFGGVAARRQRDLARKLDELGDLAGDRLQRLSEHEFRELDDAERAAALDAAVDVLTEADLSDETLLRTDLDPTSLAREVRAQVPSAARRAGLGEPGRALFDLALDQVCVQLVHLVRELPEYDDRLAEESLRRLSSALSGIDQLLDRLPVTSLDAPAGTDHDEQFRRRYLDLAARHYDDVELIGVSVRNFRPRTKLSVAYMSLTVDGAARQVSLLDWFRQNDGQQESGQRVESALSTANRMLVRGEAGSGKSTLLRWLAVTAAREQFDDELAGINGCAPVLIKLRSHTAGKLPRPESFLEEPTGPICGPIPDGWMHRQISAGRVLLLVDGVDEVSEHQRREVREWLRTLSASYPQTRIVVTSRPAAASTRWLEAEDYGAVLLERMSPQDVRVFLERWHQALLAADRDSLPFDRTEVEQRHRSLLTQLDQHAHLRTMARNPLMCAMLCALHLDRGGSLPRDRKSLYEAALEMLLERRENERGIRHDIGLTYREKITLLQDLAFWLNINGRAELDRATALRRVERKLESLPGTNESAEACLHHLVHRSGVIREPVPGRIDFVHRTFGEFLAAREAAEDDHVGLLIDKSHQDQWRETVIMAAGLLARRARAELLIGLLDKADESGQRHARRLRLLAVTCRESVHELPGEVSERLNDAVGRLVPPRDRRESRSLATVGEPLLDHLPDELAELTDAQASACVRTVALINGPRAMAKLEHYASDPRTSVQREISRAWELFDPASYAEHVLNRAQLPGGRLSVRKYSLIQHVHRVSGIRQLSLFFLDGGPLPGLEFLTDLKPVDILFGNIRGRASLEPIAAHAETLESVILGGAQSFHDLPLIREMPALRELMLAQQDPVRDLSALRDAEQLELLMLPSLHRVQDTNPISSLTNLHTIRLSSCHLFPTKELIHLEKLREITILGNKEAALISDLARIQQIQELTLGDCLITDIGPLNELRQLSSLHIRDNPNTIDLSPFAGSRLRITLDQQQRTTGEQELGDGVRVIRH